mmetsp:Transcript_9462/g.34428  ORF Transcript_9462/g.34428 Transcript_9462/m.34428 type:complete len:212 (+) Transcript_9462:1240-1875(+)
MPMGATMPPSAPKHGRSAALTLEREPKTNSRLISRPTMKKKMAMRPSLTHSCALRWRPSEAGPMWKCSQNPMKPPLIAEFARKSDSAVAPRSMMEPRPWSRSSWMSISLHFFSRTSPSPSTTATDDGDDAGMTERLAELRPSATGARADAMVADARALLEDAFTEKTGAFAETRARATRVVFAAIAEAESPEIVIAAMFARIEGVSVLGVR